MAHRAGGAAYKALDLLGHSANHTASIIKFFYAVVFVFICLSCFFRGLEGFACLVNGCQDRIETSLCELKSSDPTKGSETFSYPGNPSAVSHEEKILSTGSLSGATASNLRTTGEKHCLRVKRPQPSSKNDTTFSTLPEYICIVYPLSPTVFNWNHIHISAHYHGKIRCPQHLPYWQ